MIALSQKRADAAMDYSPGRRSRPPLGQGLRQRTRSPRLHRRSCKVQNRRVSPICATSRDEPDDGMYASSDFALVKRASGRVFRFRANPAP